MKDSLVIAMLRAVASSASSLTRGGTAQRRRKRAQLQVAEMDTKRVRKKSFAEKRVSSGCLCRAVRVRIPSQSKGRKTKRD
jgi:hypothetical protein